MGASRRFRRRCARGDRSAYLAAAVLDVDEVKRRLSACSCPAVVIPGTPPVVEHYHAANCPELAKAKRGEP